MPRNDVDDSGGQTSFLAKLSKGERSQRSKFRGLQDHRISGGQSRSNLPRRHEQRKIPGDNLTDNSTRFVLRKFLLEKLRPTCVVVEMPGNEGNIDVATFANRLSVVDSLENGKEAGMFLDQARERIKVTCSNVGSEGSPLRKRGARGPHGGVDIGG